MHSERASLKVATRPGSLVILLLLLALVFSWSPPVTCASAMTTDVYEWSARVRVDRNALGISFNVLVFVGNGTDATTSIGTKPAEWYESPHLAGMVAAIPLSSTSSGVEESAVVMQGFVGLNDLLEERLETLHPETVVPYLQSNMFWKAVQPDRKGPGAEDVEVVLTNLESLEVTVLSGKLKEVQDLLPVYEDPVEHKEVTREKQGGVA